MICSVISGAVCTSTGIIVQDPTVSARRAGRILSDLIHLRMWKAKQVFLQRSVRRTENQTEKALEARSPLYR